MLTFQQIHESLATPLTLAATMDPTMTPVRTSMVPSTMSPKILYIQAPPVVHLSLDLQASCSMIHYKACLVLLHCAVSTPPSHPPVHPAGHLAGHPSAEHQLTTMPSPSASGAASSMPHYVALFEGSLTKDGRKLLASAIESHRSLVNCIDNTDTSSDASTTIRPLHHSLSSPALHNMLMDNTQFDVIHMGHRYNTLNGMSSAYARSPSPNPFSNRYSVNDTGSSQYITENLNLQLRDMNNEADTNEDASSPSGIELTGQQDSEAMPEEICFPQL
ncbi:hypothetical protein M422DRAFT_248688 [Sphaerobolus stellatus SS14]|nr:hypothetical protein M422DRAFT_248688 [Sphaerobolus stellatus SS14]